MKRPQKKGFTLIEILITVTILSILATVAMANYTNTRKKQQYNGAVATVRTIAAVAKSYFLSQGWFPSTGSTAATNSMYGTSVVDGFFNNYRINRIVGPPESFNITVAGGSATYTFSRDGARLTCVGADCIF